MLRTCTDNDLQPGYGRCVQGIHYGKMQTQCGAVVVVAVLALLSASALARPQIGRQLAQWAIQQNRQ